MKPIPGHRGLRYEVTRTTTDGHPLRVSFMLQPGGPLDHHLIKHPALNHRPEAEQAASPWYLRYIQPGGRRSWKRIGADIRPDTSAAEAVKFLQTAPADSTAFTRWLDQVSERATLTVGQLLDEYLEAGCPDRRLRPRAGRALREERRILALARRWWAPKGARSVNAADCDEFVAWRQADVQARRAAGDLRVSGSGLRAAELELAALSNALEFAVRRRRLDGNPLATRPNYRHADDIEHAHARQPATDEELHQIGRWMIQTGREVSAARVLFQALSGLRCGEYQLIWDALAGQPGHQFSGIRDGRRVDLLWVVREKRGLDPAVEIHPALASFIAAWRRHCRAHWPSSPHWFPQATFPDRPQAGDDSGRDLAAACAALGLPRRTTHGLRAFYVTTLRSQGISDSTIASRLGHRSGAGLIATTYGQPHQVFGTLTHDWLPNDGVPAWELFGGPAAGVLAADFKGGRVEPVEQAGEAALDLSPDKIPGLGIR